MSEPSRDDDPKAALEEAIRNAGGQTALGRGIHKSQSHVATWLRRGRCPAEVVLLIEEKTRVSRHRLRPDVFGPEPSAGVTGNDQQRGAAA